MIEYLCNINIVVLLDKECLICVSIVVGELFERWFVFYLVLVLKYNVRYFMFVVVVFKIV